MIDRLNRVTWFWVKFRIGHLLSCRHPWEVIGGVEACPECGVWRYP